MQLDGLESIADLAATAADHKDEEEKDELDTNSRDYAKYSPQITKLQVQEKMGEWNFFFGGGGNFKYVFFGKDLRLQFFC